jgi:hypothetical protein
MSGFTKKKQILDEATIISYSNSSGLKHPVSILNQINKIETLQQKIGKEKHGIENFSRLNKLHCPTLSFNTKR